MNNRITFLLAALVTLAASARADVKLPAIFGDQMVLQQGSKLPVWGWAEAGEKVVVSVAGQRATTTAGADGKWMVKLEPVKVTGEPIELTVAGKNTITVKDVLVGEVWVCSGQSNMEWPLWATNGGREEAAKANYPKMRFFKVGHKTSIEPQTDCVGKWEVCATNTAGGFSGVGYYFGRDLHRNLGVPVGLIGSHWGGTMIQAWTSLEGAKSDAAFQPFVKAYEDLVANKTKYEEEYKTKTLPAWEEENKKWIEEVRKPYEEACRAWEAEVKKAKAEGRALPAKPTQSRQPRGKPSCRTESANNSTALFNGMIAPLLPFAIKGAIWYQGESNANNPPLYGKQLPALIADWRKHWGQGNFPFLFVQLPNFSTTSDWAAMREVQSKALAVPATGMAVTIDVGDHKNIHPANKFDVGRRLALVARHVAYGQELVYTGPVYKSMKIEAGKVRLSFDHVGSGLKADSAVKGFTIAGDDQKFVPAEGKFEGNNVIVWSDQVAKPVAVRYAWANDPEANLYNKELLPAAPFRTDDWKTK